MPNSRKQKKPPTHSAWHFDFDIHYCVCVCLWKRYLFKSFSLKKNVFYFSYRSGLFTDILLVLIVSITCVQTKEIKNSSVFPQNSDTNRSSIETSSTSDTRFHDHAVDNHTWIQSTIDISATDSNQTTSIDHTTKHPMDHFIGHQIQQQHQYQHQQQNQQKQQTNHINTIDAQLFNTNYSIDNLNRISLNNDLAQVELPTKIDRTFYTSNTVQNEPTHQRIGKQSTIFRTALRVAARQGLEAMVELYDKKEPNLIKKGQFWEFEIRTANKRFHWFIILKNEWMNESTRFRFSNRSIYYEIQLTAFCNLNFDTFLCFLPKRLLICVHSERFFLPISTSIHSFDLYWSLGFILPADHPGAMLSHFSSPISDEAQNSSKAAYAALFTAKKLKNKWVTLKFFLLEINTKNKDEYFMKCSHISWVNYWKILFIKTSSLTTAVIKTNRLNMLPLAHKHTHTLIPLITNYSRSNL